METKRDNRAQFKAAKAVARLTTIIPEMCAHLTMPTGQDTTSLRNLQREASKLASEAARTRNDWLKQIRPYYIIDMMTLGGNIDKVRRLSDELHNFLIGRGSVIRSLEQLDEKLGSLSKLQALKESASSQRELVERKLSETELLDKSLREQVREIRQNPRIKEYLDVDSGLRALRAELIRTGFSRLGRPLKKLISISERGEYPLPVEVRDSAKEYVRKPFATFLTEEQGYPRLKAVLSAVSGAVSTGKLALKQREAKKVIERTEQVVAENSLMDIYAKAMELKATYDRFLADPETANLVQQLKDLRQKGRANHTFQEEGDGELQRAIKNEKRLEEQITASLKEIEAFARKLSGADLRLHLA